MRSVFQNAFKTAAVAVVFFALPLLGTQARADHPVVQTPTDTEQLEFLNSYCVSCHSGAQPKAGVALTNVAGAKAAATRAHKELATLKMPPANAAHQPTSDERAKIISWFVAEEPPATTDEQQTHLLATYCVGCHGTTHPRGNIAFDTLEHAKAAAATAEGVLLLGQMPTSRAPVQPNADERSAMEDWFVHAQIPASR